MKKLCLISFLLISLGSNNGYSEGVVSASQAATGIGGGTATIDMKNVASSMSAQKVEDDAAAKAKAEANNIDAEIQKKVDYTKSLYNGERYIGGSWVPLINTLDEIYPKLDKTPNLLPERKADLAFQIPGAQNSDNNREKAELKKYYMAAINAKEPITNIAVMKKITEVLVKVGKLSGNELTALDLKIKADQEDAKATPDATATAANSTLDEVAAKKKAEDEAAAKKKIEDEVAAKKKVEDEAAAKKKAEDEAAAKKKAEDEAAAKKNAEDEAAAKKKAEDEAAAKKKAEDEAAAKKKAEDEAAAKKKAEDEAAAKKKAEDEAAAKKNAEDEAAAKKKEVGPFDESNLAKKFSDSLKKYIDCAKDLLNKNMTDQDKKELSVMVKGIISDLKKDYLGDKIKTEDIVLEYKDKSSFPNLSKHDLKDKYNEQLAKFTIAMYGIFKNLTEDYIDKVIEKSPIEFVSLLQELQTFITFIAADPTKYGQGIFREKVDQKTVIYADDDAITRIMGPAILKLLGTKDDRIFKLSRIASLFYKEFTGQTGKDVDAIFNKAVDDMKRNATDDSRICLYGDKNSYLTSLPEITTGKDFESVKNNYICEVGKCATEKDEKTKQELHGKILEAMKELFGIRDGVKISIANHVNEFCDKLDEKVKEFTKGLKDNDKKTVRDIENYTEISKILRKVSLLLEELYNNRGLLDQILEKDSLSAISMAKEIMNMLSVLDLILKDKNEIDSKIEKMREFARSSEDGTYLLSSVISNAMQDEKTDLKKNVAEIDFLKRDQRRFLKIR